MKEELKHSAKTDAIEMDIINKLELVAKGSGAITLTGLSALAGITVVDAAISYTGDWSPAVCIAVGGMACASGGLGYAAYKFWKGASKSANRLVKYEISNKDLYD